jgi:Uma2 family endonuclease
MSLVPTRRRFTVEEYYRMADAGILTEDARVELIDGEIIQIPPISGPHASCVDRIVELFARVLIGLAQIRAQNPIDLGEGSEPIPDVMLLRRRPDFYSARHPTAEDVFLLVEVSDTTLRYDQRVKLPLYARHNIPEVWDVDLKRELILVYREPTLDGYRIVETRRRGEHTIPAQFPQFSFAVADILG